MSPTEAAKEAFRAAYKRYQDASQALAAAQKDLLLATSTSSEVFRSSRPNAGAGGVEDWDGAKARRAALAIHSLGKHYELVAVALKGQASALEHVTEMATMIIEAIGPSKYAAEGSP